MVRPASPSNLNASVISCSQINLSWTDNSGIEEGYRVYRNGNVIATLSAGSTSYQDTGLSASTPYSYQVTAHRVGGVESNFSNTAPATTPSCNVTPPSLLTPTNGAIIDEGQTIALSWTATGNEYFGEITGGPGGTLTFGWQTGTSKNIGSQWAGYDYSWRVKARNGSTESVWSSIRTFRVRPGMPGNLSASAISCSQINLSWSDNSGNEEGYRVYRNGVPIATLPSNSNSYQNTGLSASTPYSYTVKAYRGSIESSSSNTASATTSPCPFPPSANFDAFPTSGDSPLDVEFHIADTTGITTCTWDYGDGTPHGSSCDSIHPHRYTNPGRYTVTFTASGPGGSDSRTLTDYIVVNGSCLPVNLLKNPSVEADTNNDSKPDLWSTNAKFTRSSETTPKQGSYVGRFRAADNSGATITQTVPNLTAGTTYDFSAWVNIPPQGDTTFTFKLQVQWKNASNGNISTTLVKNYTTVTNGWNEATVDLVAPPGTVSAVVKMVASSLNGTIYVDDFFFGTIDCPQTIPDLVIGSITPLPVNPQIGQAVSFAVVINNQGTADAASFYVDLYIDNPLPSSCGGVGQIYQYVAGLAAGASQTITLPYSGFSVDGSHTVNGLIDTDCVIDEDNDTNNSKSITLTVGNLIFANSFEDDDCFVTQWTSCVDDSGDLQFTDPPAPLKDNASMMITVDDNNLVYVASDHPDAERRYRARFYFDPNSISMVSGNAHFILYGYNGTSKVVLRVEFRNSSGSYQLRAGLLNDASNWTNSSWFTITDAPHFIEFDWRAASVAGANNGGLTLWIDGVQKANLAAVDNDTWRMDRVRLGAVNGIDAGTRGTYFFDAFASGRETYIGP